MRNIVRVKYRLHKQASEKENDIQKKGWTEPTAEWYIDRIIWNIFQINVLISYKCAERKDDPISRIAFHAYN